MIAPQVTCDVCGAEKRETNHWLVAVTYAELAGIAFIPADIAEGTRGTNDGRYEDICGHACAHKRFSQWLETLIQPTRLTQLTPKGASDDRQEALQS